MVTHWESSGRPLYIRTVWRDGQHHVVLRREEESNASRSVTASPSSRSIRSVSKSSSTRTVSSVKLFLAGVGNTGEPEHKLRRCKTSVKFSKDEEAWESLPVRPVSFREAFGRKTNKNFNLSVKSLSIDVHGGREPDDKTRILTPYFNCNKCRDTRNNSLSERVMVWLDLASQNGNYTKQTKVQPKRIVTASHVSQKRHQTAVKSKTFTHHQLNVDSKKKEVTSHEEGSLDSLQFMILKDGSIGDKENAAAVLASSTSEDDSAPRLISEAEESVVSVELEEDLTKNKITTAKRQLHIFMPNLPKKNSDCDSSILSSKISGSSLQRSLKSWKI